MLKQFLTFLNNQKIDILAGHNIFEFDLPFIVSRCEHYKLKHPFKISTNSITLTNTKHNGNEIKFYPYFFKNISIIDTYHLVAMHDFIARKLTSYNLKNATIELGLRDERRLELTADEIKDEYVNGRYEKIIEYLKYDLDDTALLLNHLLPSYYYQKSVLPKWSIYDLVYRGNASKWNAIVQGFYRDTPMADDKVDYEGGLCWAKQGLYRNCCKIDVQSLYPSIMLNYRVHSRKDKDAKMLSVLKYLTDERLRLKELAKKGDVEAKRMQSALKVIINSAYGFLGTEKVAFNDYQAAAKVTAYGREILKHMIKTVESCGGVVCEADTDGIFFILMITGWLSKRFKNPYLRV